MTDDVQDAVRVGLDPHNHSPTRLEKSRKALCAADFADLKRDLLQAIGRELFDRRKGMT